MHNGARKTRFGRVSGAFIAENSGASAARYPPPHPRQPPMATNNAPLLLHAWNNTFIDNSDTFWISCFCPPPSLLFVLKPILWRRTPEPPGSDGDITRTDYMGSGVCVVSTPTFPSRTAYRTEHTDSRHTNPPPSTCLPTTTPRPPSLPSSRTLLVKLLKTSKRKSRPTAPLIPNWMSAKTSGSSSTLLLSKGGTYATFPPATSSTWTCHSMRLLPHQPSRSSVCPLACSTGTTTSSLPVYVLFLVHVLSPSLILLQAEPGQRLAVRRLLR